MVRHMKDSGIEWVGKIPERWDLKRLKALLVERKEKNDPVKTNFILSLGANYGVIPYSEKEGGGNKAKEDYTAYNLAYPNDIVMNSMNIISGAVGISKYYGCVSPVYFVLYARNKNVDIKFFNYMFQSKAFQRSLLGLGNGILIKESSNGNFNTVRMRIPIGKLNVLLLPNPTISEQQHISSFLDSKCQDIDNVLAKTRSSIEEYKKLKQAIITKAVTKGIRKNRKMKDSGIEWIGNMPEEWIFAELKYFVNLINGKEIDIEVDKEQSEAIPVYGSGGIFKYTNNYMYEGIGVLFGRKGTLGKPIYINDKFWIVDTAYLLNCRDNLNSKFCYYLLCAFDWGEHITQTALPSIVATDIISCKFPIPAITEQKELVSFLDIKCSQIDNLISKKEQLISELESYKKSLIYEYVTGKKEVPMA